MFFSTAMTTTFLLIFIFLTFSLIATAATAPPKAVKSPLSPPEAVKSPLPQPPIPKNCSDELVSFSICLPYISSHPNNVTDWPSYQCCDDVVSLFISETAICLCHFIQKPLLLGFPLNSTRLYSLTSLCPMPDTGTKAKVSLLSLCSGAHKLPPLLSITGPGQTGQNAFDNLGSDNSPPPPPPPSGLTQEEAGASDAIYDYETEPTTTDGGSDQQQSPAIEVTDTVPPISFAWKRNNSKYGLFIPLIMILVTRILM